MERRPAFSSHLLNGSYRQLAVYLQRSRKASLTLAAQNGMTLRGESWIQPHLGRLGRGMLQNNFITQSENLPERGLCELRRFSWFSFSVLHWQRIIWKKTRKKSSKRKSRR